MSNRCAPCNVNWPFATFCEFCPRCGGETFKHTDRPDHSLTEAEAIEAQRTADAWKTGDEDRRAEDRPEDVDDSTPHGSRVAAYLRLGFDTVAAHQLADAKTREFTTSKAGAQLGWNLPLYHGKVAAALAAGCTHEQAVSIYA